MRRTRNLHAEFLFTLSALAFTSSGCASWSRSAAAPSARIPPRETRDVRAHLKDGRVVVLEHAEVVGDSLIGNVPGKLPFDPPRHRDRPEPGPRVAIALADIATLDVQKTSVVRTAGLIMVFAGAAFLLVMLEALDELPFR